MDEPHTFSKAATHPATSKEAGSGTGAQTDRVAFGQKEGGEVGTPCCACVH
jgi:hypothetical protein